MSKNILITGASSGFGKEILAVLQKAGYNAIGTTRNIERYADREDFLALDVTNQASVDHCIKTFIRKYGDIDVLINNAGTVLTGPVESTSIEEAKLQFETNFFGIVRMNQAVIPLMRSKNKGIILHISSIGGFVGVPYQAFYSATKFALEGYIESLRIEVRNTKLEVFSVCPGDSNTNISNNRTLVNSIPPYYQSEMDHMVRQLEKCEKEGFKPKKLALFILKLIRKEKGFNVRYYFGALLQRWAPRIKSFVPSKVFQYLIEMIYKL